MLGGCGGVSQGVPLACAGLLLPVLYISPIFFLVIDTVPGIRWTQPRAPAASIDVGPNCSCPKEAGPGGRSDGGE